MGRREHKTVAPRIDPETHAWFDEHFSSVNAGVEACLYLFPRLYTTTLVRWRTHGGLTKIDAAWLIESLYDVIETIPIRHVGRHTRSIVNGYLDQALTLGEISPQRRGIVGDVILRMSAWELICLELWAREYWAREYVEGQPNCDEWLEKITCLASVELATKSEGDET